MMRELPADPDKQRNQPQSTECAGGLSKHTELPAARAFVVQFTRSSDIDNTRLEGSAQHVESGMRRHFHDLAELLEFFGVAVAESEHKSSSS
jgi:hypothetical protein